MDCAGHRHSRVGHDHPCRDLPGSARETRVPDPVSQHGPLHPLVPTTFPAADHRLRTRAVERCDGLEAARRRMVTPIGDDTYELRAGSDGRVYSELPLPRDPARLLIFA